MFYKKLFIIVKKINAHIYETDTPLRLYMSSFVRPINPLCDILQTKICNFDHRKKIKNEQHTFRTDRFFNYFH